MRGSLAMGLAAAVMMAGLAGRLPAAETGGAGAGGGPLSGDEVKKLVNAGQYQDALKALIRILDLKGAAAAGYDRHEMLMLRAECQLQIKQSAAALDTLEVARKEAVAAADDDQAMEAMALAALIKASPGGMYTPLTGTIRKPVPIADRILRKAAYDSLLADQMVQINVKVRQAKAAGKLPPLAEAAKQVVALRPVEHASTGNNKLTDDLLKGLAKDSLKMIGGATDDLAANTKRISDAANQLITDNVTLTDGMGHAYQTTQTHRAGLNKQDTQNLKDIIAETAKIAAAATELAQFFTSVDPAPFKAVANKALTTKDAANKALTDDYTSNVAH